MKNKNWKKRFVKYVAATAVLVSMNSACKTIEVPGPTVNDYCLLAKPLGFNIASVEVATGEEDDVGNIFDTDETVEAILVANGVYYRNCPENDDDQE